METNAGHLPGPMSSIWWAPPECGLITSNKTPSAVPQQHWVHLLAALILSSPSSLTYTLHQQLLGRNLSPFPRLLNAPFNTNTN